MRKITYKGNTLYVMTEEEKVKLDKVVKPILQAKNGELVQ